MAFGLPFRDKSVRERWSNDMLDGVQHGLKASDLQVGGNHYEGMSIQPSEFIYKNDLSWLEGNAIKYICRHHAKGGEQDIDKAIHYLNLLKEWEYGKA